MKLLFCPEKKKKIFRIIKSFAGGFLHNGNKKMSNVEKNQINSIQRRGRLFAKSDLERCVEVIIPATILPMKTML